MFSLVIIFFGGGGIFFLLRLVSPQNLLEKFVKYDIPIEKKMLYKEFQQQVEYQGIFTYTVDGFIVHWQKRTGFYKWGDIFAVFGYRVGRFADSETCIDIFTDKENITFTENTPGWFVFIKKLSENISLPTGDWETKILTSGDGRTLTLLFDKEGRTLAQARKECYKK